MNDTQENATDARLNPASLTPGDAARLLKVKAEWVEADIEAGAPTNADGTLNLVAYAAWLSAACAQSAQTRSEPEGRVPKGCDGEAAHNLQMREDDDADA